MANEIDVTTSSPSVETTPASTVSSTSTDSAATEAGYYIRGVYVAAKSVASGNATAGDTETTTARVSRYKPWQMRSWGGGSDASDANDAKETKKPQPSNRESTVKSSSSHWGLIRGR